LNRKSLFVEINIPCNGNSVGHSLWLAIGIWLFSWSHLRTLRSRLDVGREAQDSGSVQIQIVVVNLRERCGRRSLISNDRHDMVVI
jgi:hypothetical protein